MHPSSTAENVLDSFGRRVAEARTSRGWTQQQVAIRLDRSLRWLQMVERGAINVPLTILIDLARCFDVEPAWFLESSKDRSRRRRGRPRKPRLFE